MSKQIHIKKALIVLAWIFFMISNPYSVDLYNGKYIYISLSALTMPEYRKYVWLYYIIRSIIIVGILYTTEKLCNEIKLKKEIAILLFCISLVILIFLIYRYSYWLFQKYSFSITVCCYSISRIMIHSLGKSV